jgi:hypothetical protein
MVLEPEGGGVKSFFTTIRVGGNPVLVGWNWQDHAGKGHRLDPVNTSPSSKKWAQSSCLDTQRH